MKHFTTLLLILLPLLSVAQEIKYIEGRGNGQSYSINNEGCHYRLQINNVTLTSDCNLDSMVIKGDTMKLIRFLIKEQYQNLPHDHK